MALLDEVSAAVDALDTTGDLRVAVDADRSDRVIVQSHPSRQLVVRVWPLVTRHGTTRVEWFSAYGLGYADTVHDAVAAGLNDTFP